MLVGIHKGYLNEFSNYLKVYEKILDYNNIDHIRLDINESAFWEKVKKLDLFIYRYYGATDMKGLANTIIPVIQNYLGIKCYPDISTGWHYDDKIKEFYLLKEMGFPIAESFIFWDKEAALQWSKEVKYPLVFKLKAGAQANSVILVENKKLARKLIHRMFGKGVYASSFSFNRSNKFKDLSIQKFLYNSAVRIHKKFKGVDLYSAWEKQKNYILFQEFLPNNDYDTRISIIGNRAFTFRRYNRKNDFRASGSGNVDYDKSLVDKRFIELAFRVSEKLNFQSMAYDFLYDINREPVICEISYTLPDQGVYDAEGYWDRDLNWTPGHFWPHLFHLSDSLGIDDLKQPDNIETWWGDDYSLLKKYQSKSK